MDYFYVSHHSISKKRPARCLFIGNNNGKPSPYHHQLLGVYLTRRMDRYYQQCCWNHKVKANSALMEVLHEEHGHGDEITEIDFSRNYVGSGNGFEAALDLLRRHATHLQVLNFSHCELSNENVKSLCDLATGLKSLHTIAMSNCGLFIDSGQQLLTALRRNKNIVNLVVESCSELPNANDIPRRIIDQIERQLQENRKSHR